MLDRQFEDIIEENKEPPKKISTAEREFTVPVKNSEDALDRSSQSLRVLEVSLYAKKLNESSLAK
jgi:hypothetical protein